MATNRPPSTLPNERDGGLIITPGRETRLHIPGKDESGPSADSTPQLVLGAGAQTDGLIGTTLTGTRSTTTPTTSSRSVENAIWPRTDGSKLSENKPGETSPKPWPPAGVKPYYLDDYACIVLGDCREILPHVSADVVVTDPPYGIAIDVRNGAGWRSPERTQCVFGDESPFDPSFLLGFERVLLWGANHYAARLPEGGRWLVWDKRDGTGSNAQADCEMAWVRGSGGTAARLYRLMWNGAVRDEERSVDRVHPTQKPLSLMRWCLGFLPLGTVLDPFAGSGTTLRAAKDLGRKAIGIEIQERYCEIAAKRCAQEILGL